MKLKNGWSLKFLKIARAIVGIVLLLLAAQWVVSHRTPNDYASKAREKSAVRPKTSLEKLHDVPVIEVISNYACHLTMYAGPGPMPLLGMTGQGIEPELEQGRPQSLLHITGWHSKQSFPLIVRRIDIRPIVLTFTLYDSGNSSRKTIAEVKVPVEFHPDGMGILAVKYSPPGSETRLKVVPFEYIQ